ncbi:inverse autotransporter beta domain-containing protein (plasmid) [Enterobacter asburiae]
MQNTVVRRTALATLVVQLLSPLSLAFTPAIASAVQPPRDTTAPADVNDSQAAQRLAQAASRAGTFLSNSPDSDAAASLARGAAAGHATAEVQQWLSQFGTARTTIDVDKDFSLKGSSLDLLVPLYDSPDLLTFAQGGIRRADDRTQSSLGLGVRSFRADSMLGASAFIDHDLSRSHTRAGLGLEYWRDNLRLGANSYMRLSGWKDSPDVTDYLERPANGWDITARGWLPSLPQLGASLGFERYYGEEVGLFGHNNRQKDPYAATAGLNWTPFPLLTLNAEQRQGKGSASDSRVGLELRYTPGVSWSQQTSPDAVAAMRSLAGGRMDLVERNNNMVLEYKKKEVITLKAQEQVTGYAGEQKPLSVELKSKYPVERIEWSAPELEAAGGIIMSSGPRSHSVTLPAWKAGGESANTYTVRGVAVDSRGNRSGESRTRVTVSQAAISPALSGLSLSSVQLVPDGTDAQTVTLTLLDASGNPVDADESEIVVERADAAGKKAKRAGGSRAQVTPFVRTGAGVYDLTVTAGTEAERFTLTPYVRGYSAGAIEVDIISSDLPVITKLELSGILNVGQKITAEYTFNSNTADPADLSVFAWSDNGDSSSILEKTGGESLVNGLVSPFMLLPQHSGKIIELSVMPINNKQEKGQIVTVTSQGTNPKLTGGYAGKIVNRFVSPRVEDLSIQGQLDIGKKLTGEYIFKSNLGHPDDRSVFLWGEANTTAGRVAVSGTPVSISGQVPEYVLKTADAGKVIELSLMAQNGADVSGNILTTDTQQAFNARTVTGGNGGLIIDRGQAPEISNLTLSGVLEVDKELKATYQFDSKAGHPDDRSVFLWGEANTTAGRVAVSGTPVSISGQVPEYVLKTADAGKVIELSLMAQNGADVSGNILTTDTQQARTVTGGNSGSIVDPQIAPEVSSLSVKGELQSGKILTAEYLFDSKAGHPDDRSVFLWGEANTTAGRVAVSGTPVSISGQVPGYVLKAEDAGKVIELSLMAQNGADVSGNTLTTDTQQAFNARTVTGGNGGLIIDRGQAPEIFNLTMSGVLEVDKELKATYQFDSKAGHPDDRSVFLWGEANTTAGRVAVSGTPVSISGQVPEYVLKAADAGKVIELSLMARNGADLNGNTLTTDTDIESGGSRVSGLSGGLIIDPRQAPEISNLTLSGVLEVDKELKATYQFDSKAGHPDDRSVFLWGEANTTAGRVAASGTPVSISGQVPEYVLKTADAGKVIELSLMAQNGADVSGNILTTDTQQAFNARTVTGGNGGLIIDRGQAPEISNLTLSGVLEVDKELKATYQFDSKAGHPDDRSVFLWGDANTTAGRVAVSGTPVSISGQVPEYVLKTADAGKVIELSLMAQNGADVSGNILTTDTQQARTVTGGNSGSIVDPQIAPEVSSLSVKGELQSGKILTAEYLFDSKAGHPDDRSVFLWGEANTTAGRVAVSGTPVSISGQVPGYVLKAEDAGKVIELSLMAQNGADVSGNTLTTDTQQAFNARTVTGGNGGLIIDRGQAPEIFNLTMSGVLEVDKELKATYQFDSKAGHPDDRSVFLWGEANTTAGRVAVSGTPVSISGQVPEYVLKAADAGKVIELSLMARNGADLNGNTLTTDTDIESGGSRVSGLSGGLIIDPRQAPEISNLTLSGVLEVDKELKATYQFDSKAGHPDDRSVFLWGEANTTAGRVAASGTPVSISGQVPEYVLKTADAGKVIELSLMAQNGADVSGNILTTDTQQAFNARTVTGGNGGLIIDRGQAPEISNLTLSGVLEVDKELKATYQFDSKAGHPDDRSVFLWGDANTTAGRVAVSGTPVSISGQVPEYVLKTADAGKVIELSLMAQNGADVSGNILTTDTQQARTVTGGNSGSIVDPQIAPEVSSLSVKGELQSGKILTAEYLFDSKAGHPDDRSVFLWGEANTTAGRVAVSGTPVSISGQVPGYVLKAEDAGKVIELSLMAQNGADVSGNTLTTDTQQAFNARTVTGGNGGLIIDRGQAPEIFNLTMSGVLEVDKELKATYQFDSKAGHPDDRSVFLWGEANTTAGRVAVSGTPVSISGQVPEYVLKAADAGKVIELSLMARNGADLNGNTLTTDTDIESGGSRVSGLSGGLIIDPRQAPEISNLTLSGVLEVDKELKATYQFDSKAGHPDDRSVFLWGEANTTAGRVAASGTPVSISGQVPEYVLKTADAGKVIELSLMAQNGADVSGNILTTDTQQAFNAQTVTGGNDGRVINPASLPAVTALTLSGTLEVGGQLGATYVFDSQNGNSEDKSAYTWGKEGLTANLVKSSNLTVEVSGKVPSYTLSNTDIGTVIELSIEARNGFGKKGNIATVKTSNSIGGSVINITTEPAWTATISATRWIWVSSGINTEGTFTFSNKNGIQTSDDQLILDVNVDNILTSVRINGNAFNISSCNPDFSTRFCSYILPAVKNGMPNTIDITVFNTGGPGGLNARIRDSSGVKLSTNSPNLWGYR